MDEMIYVKEAAMRWHLTARRVNEMCKNGQIAGVKKQGRSWLIPADTPRPQDHRVKSGAYKKQNRKPGLSLPIGVSDYRLAQEYYYVDKTLMIKDFLDERPMVSLFTRPRRFGKTLNMDMLRTFFEKTAEDTSLYFEDKKIWACGEKYRAFQGKYPVIFISFKDVKKESWTETYRSISENIAMEFKRHAELNDPQKNADYHYYLRVVDGTADRNDLEISLQMLSKMLHESYGTAPIIIIDEYDTPIQQGHLRGFYDEVILFVRNLFSGGLKDNKHLSFGFLTGILRVAKESIFSGLNNLTINSILDDKYSQYFGFTADEVREMARYYHAEEKMEEIAAWYDGYCFGKTEIFNPWSVINYFRNDCRPGAYWQSTGSNEIIGEVLTEAGEEIYDRLQRLLQGESFVTYIDTSVIYPQIRSNPSSVYSFLLIAGYLKALDTGLSVTGDFMCEVALPNREIRLIYNKEILQKCSHIIPAAASISIQEALYTGNVLSLKTELHKLLRESVSYYDTAGENFYHGLVLGLCAAMSDRYYVTSNRESGYGRYDIQLMPKEHDFPGILIELKAMKHCDHLKSLAAEALQQIKEQSYAAEMQAKGITNICKYGVAFSGKYVEICME